MPRPTKRRRVCHFPHTLEFLPLNPEPEKAAIVLTVDEYETLRLIDKEGISQEDCSQRMEIARTTVQKIYASARKKLATALVDGFPLRIEGGDFQLCDGERSDCISGGCFKRQYHAKYQKAKGENVMRIAVTFEDGQVFQHFGHTKQFKLYDVVDGVVVSAQVVDTNGSGHGALAGILTALNVDVLICGGIGGGAQSALAAAGIKLYGGVSGNADENVQAFLNDRLQFNPNVQCNHHGKHHEHTCGEHGCGQHHHN